MPPILLPHKFTPRPYQIPLLAARDRGAKRMVVVWHRRAGKEKTLFNMIIKESLKRRGLYFYAFPTAVQARKAIWDGMDRSGFPFMGHLPPGYVVKTIEDEMKIYTASGSLIQCIGTENIDAIMSTNPIGMVFAEYSLQDPFAWGYVRPIMAENDGWAAFDFVPRGKNHAYEIYEIAKREMEAGNPDWFCSRLTVDDTKAISPQAIADDRRDGMSEAMVQQEYYVSFEGVLQGSILGQQLDQADRDGRICPVPWLPDVEVDTWWDIGTGDPTAIWFTQNVGREIHVIDHYRNSGVGVGIGHYVKELRQRPYTYGKHHGPHDLDAHQFAADGKSAMEVAAALGFKFEIVPKLPLYDGINAGRAIMAVCWFDRVKTAEGRNALGSYHYTWDDKRKMFTSVPYHDWSSNDADAWRYLGVGHKFTTAKRKEQPAPRQLQTVGAGNAAWMGQ